MKRLRRRRKKREKKGGKKGEKKKRRMKIVATTSLPAVDCPNADRWNAARSRQYVGVISVLRMRFTWDLSQISVWCFGYTWDMHEICLRYACDDLKTENVQPLVDSRNMHVQDMIWGYHWVWGWERGWMPKYLDSFLWSGEFFFFWEGGGSILFILSCFLVLGCNFKCFKGNMHH